MRVLVLGGTTEATALAHRLAQHPHISATLSFAGRTTAPVPPPVPFRVGGFGGVAGLHAYLQAQRIDAVVDATHPFAAQMSRHAAAACEALRLPLVRLTRPAWRPVAGDRWIEVASIEDAVDALGPAPRRVFLTVGSLALAAFGRAPQHAYLVRAIDPPAALGLLPHHRLLLARGPFAVADEIALMRDAGTELVVSKNSGGSATFAKIEAARHLGLPVVMVRRPELPPAETLHDPDAVLAWLADHGRSP